MKLAFPPGDQSVQMHHIVATRTLQEVVDILGDVQNVELRLQAGDAFVGFVGPCRLYPVEPQFVEPQDESRVSSPAAGTGYVLDAVVLPQAVGIAEGGDATFGGQPRAAKHDYRFFPRRVLFGHSC